MPYLVAFALVVSVLAVMATVAMMVFGQQVAQQVSSLWQQAPQALAKVQATFGFSISIEDILRNQAGSSTASFLAPFSKAGSFLFDIGSSLIVVIAGAIYLALDLDRYRRGILALTPPASRSAINAVMAATAEAWRRWFAAQLIAMALVGSLMSIGTAVIGLPSPLALGLIAGLLEFVPLVGSFLGGVPALLVALAEGGNAVWWTLGLIFAVQQIESNIVSPLIQARMISLPPAVVLFAIVAGGILLGPVGVLIAVPVTILTQMLLLEFYVREFLCEDADVPESR